MAEYSKGYGDKKNWLKWILVYVVVGGLVYFAVYYFVKMGSKTPYSY